MRRCVVIPKDIRLYNQHIAATKEQELDPKSSTPDQPVVRDIWTLVFTDKTYGDRILISFPRETRDELVNQLTSGIVLAGGELPKL